MERVSFNDRLVQIVENEFNGNRSRAAREIGIPRRYLYGILDGRAHNLKTKKKFKIELRKPALVAFYRESDGTLVDLGFKDIRRIGTIDNYVGRTIRECREEFGLSIAQLARESGVDDGNISSYELGKKSPNTSTIYPISLTLELALEWLPDEIYRVHPSFAGGRIPFRARLVQIIDKKFGRNHSRAASGMGISLWHLHYILKHGAQLDTIEIMKAELEKPATVVFYRESDGRLVDLGFKDFRKIGTIDYYVGRAIRECRDEWELSTAKLARESGVDQSNISKYELGRVQPLSPAVDRMSFPLHIVPYWLPDEVYRVHPSFARQGRVVPAYPLRKSA